MPLGNCNVITYHSLLYINIGELINKKYLICSMVNKDFLILIKYGERTVNVRSG